MKKKNLIIILVIVIVLIITLAIGGIFFFLNKDTDDKKEETSQNNSSKNITNNDTDDKNVDNNSTKKFSNADDLLDTFTDNYNDQDSKKLANLINITELKKFAKNIKIDEEFENMTTKELEKTYDFIFDKLDIEYEKNDFTKIESLDDMEKVFGDSIFSDEDEYNKQLGDYVVYAIPIKDLDTSDLIIIKENKKEYTLVATRLLISGIGEMYYEIDTTNDNDNDNNDDNNDNNNSYDLAGKMSEQEIELFNASFNVYEGNQKGSTVKMLLDSIAFSNNSYADENDKLITIMYVSTNSDTNENQTITPKNTSDISNIRSQISSGNQYTVSFLKDNDGRINTVIIEY